MQDKTSMINRALEVIKSRKDFHKVQFIILYGSVFENHFLHDAYQTIKKFGDFKKYYYDYIGEEMIT